MDLGIASPDALKASRIKLTWFKDRSVIVFKVLGKRVLKLMKVTVKKVLEILTVLFSFVFFLISVILQTLFPLSSLALRLLKFPFATLGRLLRLKRARHSTSIAADRGKF